MIQEIAIEKAFDWAFKFAIVVIEKLPRLRTKEKKAKSFPQEALVLVAQTCQAFVLLAKGFRHIARDPLVAFEPAYKLDICCIPETDEQKIKDKLVEYFDRAWESWSNLAETYPLIASTTLSNLDANYFNKIGEIRQALNEPNINRTKILEDASEIFQKFALVLSKSERLIGVNNEVKTEASINLKSLGKGIAPWIIPCSAFDCTWRQNGGCASKLGFYPWEAIILASITFSDDVEKDTINNKCRIFMETANIFEYNINWDMLTPKELDKALNQLIALKLIEEYKCNKNKICIKLTSSGRRIGEIWYAWWRNRHMYNWIMYKNCIECYGHPLKTIL